MKRKMIGAAAAYMSGLFFAFFFTDIYGVVIFAAVSVIVFFGAKKRGFGMRDLCIIAVFFLIAFGVGKLHDYLCYDMIMNYSGHISSFSGKVSDYDIHERDGVSYVLEGRINEFQKAKVYMYSNDLGVDYGDEIIIDECVFSPIESDFLFDSETWNRSRHVFLQIDKCNEIVVKNNDSAHFRKILRGFRKNMIDKMTVIMGEETSAFLAGMIFGEKEYLDDNIRTSLYRSGIGHVLAVSGLHVSIIAAIIMRIFRRLHMNKYVSFAAVNLLLMFLIILANYPVSAIRAAIMLDIMYSARLFRRQSDPLNSIAAASLMICAVDPYAVYSGGFMLSLSGTFGIAVLAPFMTKDMPKDTMKERIFLSFMTAVWTTISIFPVSIFYFEETSLLSPVSNVLIVSVCTAAMVLGLLFIISGGIFTIVLYPAKWLIFAVFDVSEFIASLPFGRIPRLNDTIPKLIVIFGASVVGIYFCFGRRRLTSILIAVGILFSVVIIHLNLLHNENALTIAVLGRGNNAAVVLTDGTRTDIFDLSGHYRSPEYVRKYLMIKGIDHVDSLILSRNSPSQSVAYSYRLEPFADYGESVGYKEICIENEEYEFRGENVTVNYDGNELIIDGGAVVNFMPSKDNRISDNGLAVYYGNITKTTVIPPQNCIFLDDTDEFADVISGMNNFEIIISGSGQYKIRSL